MEDYKEKYNKLVEAVKALQEMNPSDEGIQNWVNDNVPELKESDDEGIRKELVEWLKRKLANPSIGFNPAKMEKWIAYLEKMKDFDKQLDEAYKNSDEVQYKRGYGKGYVDGMVAAKKKELEKQGAIKDGNSIDPNFGKPIITDCGAKEKIQEKIIELSHKEDQGWSEEDDKWKWDEDDEKFVKENIFIGLGNIDGVSPELYSKIIDWISLIKRRLS